MKKQPTIEDVANATSLSISTISLVLNDKPHVSERTRRKVLQVISDLGYHPHRGARGLASKLSGNIGFIVSNDHFTQVEPFYTKIFLGTEFEARDHDYYVLLTTVGKSFNKKSSSIPRFLLERNVDGIIVAGKVQDSLLDYIDSLSLPMVLVDYSSTKKRYTSILIDNKAGVHAAVSHLVTQGHRQIALIGGDLSHPSIAERCLGYTEALAENGIAYETAFVVTDEKDTRVHNGYDATERLFAHRVKPTAILAVNDAMAIGCIRYLKSIGKLIPSDVAVVGFDDIEMSVHMEPRLTTVKVLKEEMGKQAVRRLVDMIKMKDEAITTVQVPVELMVRESSGGVSEPVDSAIAAQTEGISL